MSNKMDWLTDKEGNIVVPKTLIKAIQELSAKVDELEVKIDELKNVTIN